MSDKPSEDNVVDDKAEPDAKMTGSAPKEDAGRSVK